MFAGPDLDHLDHIIDLDNARVLKNAVIYGANAAGKTSFIKALEFSQNLILRGTGYSSIYKDSYCRTKSENKDKLSHFEYLFEFEKQCYYYGFDIILSSRKIVREWLFTYDVSTNVEDLIFDYDWVNKNNLKLGKRFDTSEIDRLSVYIDDLAEDSKVLFLTEMNKKNINEDSSLYVFKKVFEWFKTHLYVNGVIASNKEEYFESSKFMSKLGINIVGFKLKDIDEGDALLQSDFIRNIEVLFNKTDLDEFAIPGIYYSRDGDKVDVKEICTLHDSSDSPFHIYEESAGVLQILELASLLNSDRDDVTYILDEYGSKMHTLLAHQFINEFQLQNRERRNQMIVATHHTSLMSTNLFRCDEIWFVDIFNGESEIYSLVDFDAKFEGKKLDRIYLEGRFGALPLFRGKL